MEYGFKEAFKSSFSLLTKMLGLAQNAFSPNMKFLRLAIFKILQFKINNFPLTSVLPFCHIAAEDLLLECRTNLLENQLILQF